MKPIVQVPHEVLTTAAKRVTKFDTKLTQLISDMKQTLLETVNPKGVGLAAPQIGAGLQVFITKPTATSAIRVFINPTILTTSPDVTDGMPERNPLSRKASEGHSKMEGCLSIPSIWGKVKRFQTLTLQFQDEQGVQHQEQFTGFLATIIQHETDHVNGILFTRRVLEQKGKLFQMVTDKDGKDSLEEMKV